MVVMIWGGQFRNVTWNRFECHHNDPHMTKNIHKPHVLHPLLPVNVLAPVISWTNRDWGLNSQCKHLLDSFGFHIHGKHSIVSSWAFPASPSLILPKRSKTILGLHSSAQVLFIIFPRCLCKMLSITSSKSSNNNDESRWPRATDVSFRFTVGRSGQEWLTSFLYLLWPASVTCNHCGNWEIGFMPLAAGKELVHL